jgi:hypothetical protein
MQKDWANSIYRLWFRSCILNVSNKNSWYLLFQSHPGDSSGWTWVYSLQKYSETRPHDEKV